MNTAKSSIQRSFIRTKEAWYADPQLVGDKLYAQEEVTFQLETPTLNGEFFIRWHELNGKQVPRLEAYDDSWRVLPYFADLFKVMESWHDQNVPPSQVCDTLMALGMTDATPREAPKHVARQPATLPPSSDIPKSGSAPRRRPR